MEQLSQIKKLDTLFNLFKDEEVGIAVHFIKEMMRGKGVEVSDIEITRYINQLISDKYIMLTPEAQYIIRIEGLLFEGYEQRLINNASENIRLGKLEIAQRENQILTTRLTILIAVGTLVASIYYLYLLIQSLCDCEFWFQK
jgi:hypothetical protein